jgi:O-glycosyl hydrolase
MGTGSAGGGTSGGSGGVSTGGSGVGGLDAGATGTGGSGGTGSTQGSGGATGGTEPGSGGGGTSSGGAPAGGSTSSGGAPAGGSTSSGGAPAGGSTSPGGEGGAGGAGAAGSGGVPLDLGPALTPDTTVGVDPSATYQTTQGWGTSLCWFGNVVGGWSDENEQAIADLLFDRELGLGLNIVRYNIGGGDAPDHDHMGYGKEMEGFKPTEAGPYDWTADANQRSVLEAAVARIAGEELVLEAFSNSPPYWMTVSGCASGNGGNNNLKSDYYDDFADYLAEVVLHFRDVWGISFRSLEPLNEPSIAWNANGGQEGCHFDRPQQAELLRQLRTTLDEKGLGEVLIAAPDEPGIDETLGSYESYDAATQAVVDQINTHIYWGSLRAELCAVAQRDGKFLWSSEVDGSGAPAPFDEFTHNHEDIAPGLDIANRITRDLKDMHVDGWVFWQAVESEQTQTSLNKNWGMLHADFENGTEQWWITKKYHVMKQYTRAIRPGYTMIDVDHPDAVAFVGTENHKLVIVQRNATTTDSIYGYDLSQFSALGPGATVHRTSATEDYTELEARPIVDGVLAVPVAPRSVTTFVVPDVVP